MWYSTRSIKRKTCIIREGGWGLPETGGRIEIEKWESKVGRRRKQNKRGRNMVVSPAGKRQLPKSNRIKGLRKVLGERTRSRK